MDNTYKMQLISSGLFKKTYSSKHEYRGRCPFCGHTGNKFYIRIDLDSDDPVMYNCFHCPAQGYLNYNLLERLGLENTITLPKDVKRMKKLPTDTGGETIKFDSITDTDNTSIVSDYIKNHFGVIPTRDDLKIFQYIGNPSVYCSEYLGMDDINSLRDTKIWFKNVNGNITGIDNSGNLKHYHSTRARDGSLYQMKTMIDTYFDINVIITDNITDCIGLYYHYKELENCMYVACGGRQYQTGIYHIFNKGIFGKGVNLHIMKNKNVKSDKIFIDNDLRKLFNKVSIYENATGTGYDVMKDNLLIQRVSRR